MLIHIIANQLQVNIYYIIAKKYAKPLFIPSPHSSADTS